MTTVVAPARRRWVFVALLTVAIIATLTYTFLDSSPGTPTTTSRDADLGAEAAGQGTGGSAVAPAPPAYLAWISGGFASDFRARVRTLDLFTAAVVIAGDTRWMTRSTDANGDVVDEPDASFAIPIDAFAVNPLEYEPFLAADIRDDVIGALDRGDGVISTRSAALRGIGVGGTMAFDDHQITIGASPRTRRSAGASCSYRVKSARPWGSWMTATCWRCPTAHQAWSGSPTSSHRCCRMARRCEWRSLATRRTCGSPAG